MNSLLKQMSDEDSSIKALKSKMGHYGVTLDGPSLATVLASTILKAANADQVPELRALVRAPWVTSIDSDHTPLPSFDGAQTGLGEDFQSLYVALVTAFSDVDGFLGPMIQLFGLELNDTNRYLLASMPESLRAMMVAETSDAAAQMEQILMSHMDMVDLLDIRIVDLSACSLEQFWGFADTTKPQMPLVFPELTQAYEDTGLLGMSEQGTDGFVGMAVNLLVMPQPDFPVSHPLVNGAASLRQTAGYLAMGQRMVFDTDNNLHAFISRCTTADVAIRQPLISLQGLTFNLLDIGMSQNISLHDPGTLRFPGVPTDLRSASPMDFRCKARKVSVFCFMESFSQ